RWRSPCRQSGSAGRPRAAATSGAVAYAEGGPHVCQHGVARPGGDDESRVDRGDRQALLLAEPGEWAALGVVDGRPAAELRVVAAAGEAGEHDVHAVLHRPRRVVEVAPVLAAGEVGGRGEIADRAVGRNRACVLREAAVVADAQPELDAVDADRGAVVTDTEVRLLLGVEVLLVVGQVDAAVG